ncbi:DUF1573 domain-containing protein [Flavobacterium sp. J49]|uniref:DUF1573 domain-containing protein n=1 Tax=Flavobacterium sp. J49 TaxID=2718534 RepID=UPI001594932E|nr:DUF1573 domain-containing protein [Flavobacterium sp. J49]MBF6640645.1 DUF1573 domain-containing protein [Flavobacterium sp. J49]NIC01892.1 DUF1573 domain-containing protein [Flavobacterium sp. J49]
MKKIILLAALVAFGVTNSNAQTAKKVATKTAAKAETPKVDGPGMLFENETIDYGTIPANSDGKREFVFVNNGTKPLIIESTQGSCGCTVPSKPEKPIQPGERGVIGVKYDTSRAGQSFQKTVTVKSNAVGQENKVLTIKGNVLPAETKVEPTKS